MRWSPNASKLGVTGVLSSIASPCASIRCGSGTMEREPFRRDRLSIRLTLIDPAHLLSEGQAEHIKERTDKFGHFFDHIEACRVIVDPPGPDVAKGRFRIRIMLSVPNTRIAVNRQTGADLPMAIRESFDAADQRLEDYVRTSKDAASRGSRRSKRKR